MTTFDKINQYLFEKVSCHKVYPIYDYFGYEELHINYKSSRFDDLLKSKINFKNKFSEFSKQMEKFCIELNNNTKSTKLVNISELKSIEDNYKAIKRLYIYSYGTCYLPSSKLFVKEKFCIVGLYHDSFIDLWVEKNKKNLFKTLLLVCMNFMAVVCKYTLFNIPAFFIDRYITH